MSQNKIDLALKYFNNGLNCSQSVFLTYSSEFGIDEKMALKISTGFGGGIGGTKNICGAILAGVMVISYKYSNGDFSENKVEKARVCRLIDEFLTHFKNENSTLKCNELIKKNVSIKPTINRRACSNLVENIVLILEDLFKIEIV